MNKGQFDYSVKAVSRCATRISRHGISRVAGGVALEVRGFRYPNDPVYIASEIMQDAYPNANIVVEGLPKPEGL